MDKTVRNLLIALALLVILTPLGLWAGGETFGEWSAEQIKEKIGYMPSGAKDIPAIWNAPLAGYDLPGLGNPTIGYVISAIIGVIVCGGALYLLGKLMVRNDGDEDEP